MSQNSRVKGFNELEGNHQQKFQVCLSLWIFHKQRIQFSCSVVSVTSDSVTPWTVAHQAPLSMGFSRQEYWSGLPCPPPGDLPDSGIEPRSLMSPALAGGFLTASATWEAE